MYSNCGYKENTVSWNSGLSYHEEHEEHKDNIMNLYYFFFVAFVNFVVTCPHCRFEDMRNSHN